MYMPRYFIGHMETVQTPSAYKVDKNYPTTTKLKLTDPTHKELEVFYFYMIRLTQSDSRLMSIYLPFNPLCTNVFILLV